MKNIPLCFKLLLLTFIFGLEIISCKRSEEPVRISQTINSNWTFNYFPSSEIDKKYTYENYNDQNWSAIALPHTWSTYETTGEIHPFIYNASGRDDSYWWYGWGCYRKRFSIDANLKDKKVFIEFDGVQKYSKVYLNGSFLGDHKGGFTSFHFDLTEYLNWEDENVLTVFVSNRRNDKHRIPPMNAGNWNVYGGIYRDVRLVVKNKVYIPFQGCYKHEGGIFVTTPEVSRQRAEVNVHTWVKNERKNEVTVELRTTIFSPEGQKIAVERLKRKINPNELTEFNQIFSPVQNPELWSPENPVLYSVKSEVYIDQVLTDKYISPLGFRFFHWDYENNYLYLNGERMNILGINRHQEYPWLGDAIPKWISRQDMVDIKYNLGHNFMRLAHYPNDEYLYELADSFGIVMVEEVPNIKSIDFDETVQEQNVREMIRRDRNHPSILFWSMGNETTDAADSKWAVEEDTTRIIHLRKGEQGGDFVQHTHENLDMENLLRVTIRGWFDEDDAPGDFCSTPENGQHAGNETWQHEMARVPGGSVRGLLGENCVAWLYADHGADREYLNCILKHINPKGWVDMYRQPKFVYWLTKAYYTNIPTVFVHPHFWRAKYIGQEKNIQIDSNCDELELFINGKSAGEKYPVQEKFNTVTYENIRVEKGTLKAVGKKGGKEYIHEVVMAGNPAKIVLTTHQKTIKADRSGISIIMADITDKDGVHVFDATNKLKWSVSGPGKLIGPEDYESDIMKHEEMSGTGYTVVPVANLVRSTNIPGKIKVAVSSEGLEPAEIEIESIKSDDCADWLNEPKLVDEGRQPVARLAGYTRETKDIPWTILPLRENHTVKGKTLKEYKQNVNSFIAKRNYGNYDIYIAYSYLVESLAGNLQKMNGYLIADEYNFFVNKFNALVFVEEHIEKLPISESEKKQIKKNNAEEAFINNNPVEIEKIFKELKNFTKEVN
ncbi:MAG: glycoside hydrolase family 2 sugar binding protein [Anaerophaga sp.]|nr:glycoside hydrolase family 2 sugar binding protein [Anaerophaga sp.]